MAGLLDHTYMAGKDWDRNPAHSFYRMLAKVAKITTRVMTNVSPPLAFTLVCRHRRPERQDRMALYCLYNSTNGECWACKNGWDSVLSGDLSTVFGVTTEEGRVTKINLGCNNLDGKDSACCLLSLAERQMLAV